jgi:Homeodomain-like domain
MRSAVKTAACLTEPPGLNSFVRVPKILTTSLSGNSGHLAVALPGQTIVGVQSPARERMIEMLKRHEIQVLRRAGHTWKEIAALSGVSGRTVRRVAAEAPVTAVDNAAERVRRQVGRLAKADAYREVVAAALTEDPALRSVEMLHRARLAGYTGARARCMAWRRRCGPVR